MSHGSSTMMLEKGKNEEGEKAKKLHRYHCPHDKCLGKNALLCGLQVTVI